MFGVAVAPSNALKTLNPGWQVSVRYVVGPGAPCANARSGVGRRDRVKTPLQFLSYKYPGVVGISSGCGLPLKHGRRLGVSVRQRHLGRDGRCSTEGLVKSGTLGVASTSTGCYIRIFRRSILTSRDLTGKAATGLRSICRPASNINRRVQARPNFITAIQRCPWWVCYLSAEMRATFLMSGVYRAKC